MIMIVGGDFSRPVNKQAIAQSATKTAPTSAITLSNPLNLMAVTQSVGTMSGSYFC
jgi:hypothetical protein